MIYKITAIRRKEVPYTDKRTGQAKSFTKTEVKTDKTGELVYELGEGHSDATKKNIKVGDIISGFTAQVPWFKKDGSGQGGVNNRLNGVTAEYVYRLVLKMNPNIEEEIPEDPRKIPENEWTDAPPADDSEEIPFD